MRTLTRRQLSLYEESRKEKANLNKRPQRAKQGPEQRRKNNEAFRNYMQSKRANQMAEEKKTAKQTPEQSKK